MSCLYIIAESIILHVAECTALGKGVACWACNMSARRRYEADAAAPIPSFGGLGRSKLDSSHLSASNTSFSLVSIIRARQLASVNFLLYTCFAQSLHGYPSTRTHPAPPLRSTRRQPVLPSPAPRRPPPPKSALFSCFHLSFVTSPPRIFCQGQPRSSLSPTLLPLPLYFFDNARL